jgi:hypothetical protein
VCADVCAQDAGRTVGHAHCRVVWVRWHDGWLHGGATHSTRGAPASTTADPCAAAGHLSARTAAGMAFWSHACDRESVHCVSDQAVHARLCALRHASPPQQLRSQRQAVAARTHLPHCHVCGRASQHGAGFVLPIRLLLACTRSTLTARPCCGWQVVWRVPPVTSPHTCEALRKSCT